MKLLRFKGILALACAWSLATVSVRAELKLAGVFTDNMVLQRELPVPVWGWANAGEKVSVEFAGQSKTAVADATGRWLVTFDPLTASAQPQTLSVRDEKSGDHLQITNVLTGEVWLASGQSNMGVPLSAAPYAKTEAASADHPEFRYRVVTTGTAQKPQADLPVAKHPEEQTHPNYWVVCSPETAPHFSGVCYFFGLELAQRLQVPVGILRSSVGGTPVEAWMSNDTLEKLPAGRAAIADWDKQLAHPQTREEYAEAERQAKAEAKAKHEPAPFFSIYQNAVDSTHRPANLYNAMIAPIAPFAFRGVIWYQGESNAHPIPRAQAYRELFPAMIENWRQLWDRDFAFLFVQLPNFHGTNRVDWAALRESQTAALALPHTGMAVAIDVGSTKTIHPPDKQPVGHRLVLQALKNVYGEKVLADGPIFDGAKFARGRAIVSFKNADAGLVAKSGGELTGFTVAGEDKNFTPAQARIVGGKVEAWSDAVLKPVAVRYAFINQPEASLFNSEKLPAAPFRSDDWPLNNPPGE